MEALQGRLSQNRQWHIHASPVPLLKHLGTNCFESPFQPKGGWIVHYETTKRKHSTGRFNVHFPPPTVLLFYWAPRRCLLHRFSISLVSLPHREKKINEDGTNLHTRLMISPATSTQTSTRWIHTARTYLLIYPTGAERWQPFIYQRLGRNFASCRYMKPLPLSAVKVSAVIRNKGQPRAEACLESIWDKHLAVQATNEQYIPPSLSGARALSIVGCKIRS